MTFSIAARCERTGMFGIAISSSSPAVAARCAWVRAGVGAACSQNVTDPRLGSMLLDLLERGQTPSEALDDLVETTPDVDFRQLSVVDRNGKSAWFSGVHCLGNVAGANNANAVAIGNLLASDAIPTAMLEAFAQEPDAHLGDRLIAALQDALRLGGEAGPVHSAGLVIVDQVSWPVTDLRVDWDGEPIERLTALWRLWRPQMDSYLTRALDPRSAPTYGVPGDSA
jgi:uncharacterized Ntn-hydrolase superfamily protein